MRVQEMTYPYWLNLLIAIDQLFNALTGGSCDETFSSRAYRRSLTSAHWKVLRNTIDLIFFFDPDHCYTSYLAEKQRRHSVKELQ